MATPQRYSSWRPDSSSSWTAGSICSRGGSGPVAALPPQAHFEPSQLATVTAALKPNAKQVADLQWSTGGSRYFVARGGFHVPKETSGGTLRRTLKRVAGITDVVVKQLEAMKIFEVQSFCPSAPAGVALVDMPTDVHFRTFIAALVAVLKHGMDNALPVCKDKVEGLKSSCWKLPRVTFKNTCCATGTSWRPTARKSGIRSFPSSILD